MRWSESGRLRSLAVVALLFVATLFAPGPADASIEAGGVLRVRVPEAIGGKTVVGQLAVDRATRSGFVTAFGCDDGLPIDMQHQVSRADLNYDGNVSAIASNRLIVKADNDGDVCFYTLHPVEMIVDINGVSFDTGITSFPNQRTDTRLGANVPVAAEGVLRVRVPEAVGGRTVVGQIAVDQAHQPGFVTAFGCDFGLPTNAVGEISRADLNYDGGLTPVWSNRLIVKADNDGDVCFYSLRQVEMIVDINGVSDVGITSFANQRTDTRLGANVPIAAGGTLRVSVPEAVGGQTVVGQIAVDNAQRSGFVTAFGCDDGLPTNAVGEISRADLNYDGGLTPVWSNRLIVKADNDGDVCLYTLGQVDMIVDINGVSDVGITSFPNQRTDTRNGATPNGEPALPVGEPAPVWPLYEPLPALDGVAALTGEPAAANITTRPILAVKIDNYWRARPQWGLDQADAIIEENVEGVTRFVALFHSREPSLIGPIRSARTGDIDLLAGMNRPVFAYSGANFGVTSWIRSAASSRLLFDFSALHSPCYSREPTRPGPHNLQLDRTCAIAATPTAGPARQLWSIDPAWVGPVGFGAVPDTTFAVKMDGVRVEWTWDPGSASYLRFQDGAAHVAASGAQIAVNNVVEVFSTYVPSPVDTRSPHPITVGSGSGVVHRDGRAIPVVWSRPTAYDPFVFTDASTGLAIPLDSGRTFIELVRDR